MTHEIDLPTDQYYNLLKDTQSIIIHTKNERYKVSDTVVFYEQSNQFGRLRSGMKISRRITAISPVYSKSRKVKSIRIHLAL